MSIISCIKRDKMQVFRRLYMKRRESGGDYEASWQQIENKRVIKFGSIGYGIDDIKLNFFKYSGLNITLDNTDGYFADENDSKSFFYQKLSRYRTLIKVDAGYIDTDGTEYPTSPTLFIGLMGEKMLYAESGKINFQCDHISKIFQEFPADRITGLGTTQTASDILTKIRDHLDANSISLFQKYISLGAWTIQTTTNNYNIATSTTLQNKSCWQLMKTLAEAENKLLYISREGNFYFQTRTATTADPTYHLSGIGDSDNTYGRNITKKISVDENIKQVYNRIRIKNNKADTTTSYYTKQETWNWGDSSSSFKFGVRTYNYSNEWLATATAQTVGDNIFNTYSWPKQLVKCETKFLPHIEINDNLSVTYKTVIYSGDSLWGYFLWGYGIFGEKSGKNINIDGNYLVENIKHNIDNFSSLVQLKEI